VLLCCCVAFPCCHRTKSLKYYSETQNLSSILQNIKISHLLFGNTKSLIYSSQTQNLIYSSQILFQFFLFLFLLQLFLSIKPQDKVPMELFEMFLEELRPRYSMESYDLLDNNCNAFSQEVFPSPCIFSSPPCTIPNIQQTPT